LGSTPNSVPDTTDGQLIYNMHTPPTRTTACRCSTGEPTEECDHPSATKIDGVMFYSATSKQVFSSYHYDNQDEMDDEDTKTADRIG
jgi:hypothetical protein